MASSWASEHPPLAAEKVKSKKQRAKTTQIKAVVVLLFFA